MKTAEKLTLLPDLRSLNKTQTHSVPVKEYDLGQVVKLTLSGLDQQPLDYRSSGIPSGTPAGVTPGVV